MSRLFHSIRQSSLQSFPWGQPQWIRRSRLSPSHILGIQRREQHRSWWHQRRQWLKDLSQHPLILGGVIWAILFLWNWIIAVAIATGTIVSVVVYLTQIDRVHVNWHPLLQPKYGSFYPNLRSSSIQLVQYLRQNCWPKLWTPANRSLSLSLFVGAAVAALVGAVELIYHETQSVSLALVIGGQFVLIAGLGGYTWWQRPASQLSDSTSNPNHSPSISANPSDQSFQENGLDPVWADLASTHPPTRLIAIYRAVTWVQTQPSLHSRPTPSLPLSIPHPLKNNIADLNVSHLMACFRLMLTHERQPTVQQALREALMTLQGQASVVSLNTDEPV